MREIKFRAWDRVECGWLECDGRFYIGLNGKIKDHNGFANFKMLDVEDVDLMQYTGIKDEDSIEIYEGDIIQNEFGAIFVIGFKNSEFISIHMPSCRNEIEGECISDNLYDFIECGDAKVIGNIHENKELLKC